MLAPSPRAAHALIARHGTTAVLLRPGEPDPLRPWEGGGDPVAYPVQIFVSNFRNLELASDNIEVSDAKILVSTDGLLIEPLTSDLIQLTAEDRDFQILSVRRVQPGNLTFYWELQAR